MATILNLDFTRVWTPSLIKRSTSIIELREYL